MRRIKQFFFLLCLLVAGAQSAWAQKTCTFNNCTYNLYGGYTSTYQGVTITVQPYAVLTGITGTAQDVVIPYSLEDGGTTYYVSSGSGFVSNDNVKTLTFQSNIDLSYCTLRCSQLTKIVFDGSVKFGRNSEEVEVSLKCASLTDIVFKGEVPALSGSWSNYCTAPVGNVTAHVAAWTAEECIDKHESNITVWHDFADIVPYNEGVEETVKVYLTVEHGWARVDGNGIYTQTTQTQTYTRNKRTNFLFEVCDNYLTYDLSEVYVNGKSVKSQMQKEGSWYNYTVEDMTGDVYIRIVGVQNTKEMWVGCNEGGTVVVTYEGESTTVQQYAMTQKFVDPDTEYEFLITPSEGYDLYKVFISVIDVTDASAFKPIPQGDGSYKITCKYNTIKYYYGGISPDYVITFKPIDKPVWTISQSDDCPRVELHSSVGSRLLEDKFVMMSDEIDATNTYKLMVYLEDEWRPVRVLCNGVDTTYQYEKYYEGALYYTMDPTKDEAWEIGFDNSHRQTFVRNGGSRESSINYETWGGDATIDISSGEVTTVLLPPYDDSQCSTVRLTINVSDDELLTVTRNGVDVTEQFDYDEEDGYRTYFFQSSIDDAQSVDTWGYSLRDPATWVINIRQSWETSIAQTFVKPESVGISLIHSYFNGQSPVEAQLTQEFNPVFFDDNDRLIYSSVELKVRTDRTQPVRVLRNGVDITFSQQLISTEEEDGVIILGYNVPLTEAATWDISYDNSHRQNVYVRGGTGLPNGDVGEWNFENVTADAYKYFKPNELVVVDLPPYNSGFNTYMTLSFFVKDNETFTAIRNGVNVTGSFASRALSTSGFRLFELDENNGEFSFDMREPATWIITIDDGSGQYDVNRDGSINVTDVTKLVDKILHP